MAHGALGAGSLEPAAACALRPNRKRKRRRRRRRRARLKRLEIAPASSGDDERHLYQRPGNLRSLADSSSSESQRHQCRGRSQRLDNDPESESESDSSGDEDNGDTCRTLDRTLHGRRPLSSVAGRVRRAGEWARPARAGKHWINMAAIVFTMFACCSLLRAAEVRRSSEISPSVKLESQLQLRRRLASASTMATATTLSQVSSEKAPQVVRDQNTYFDADELSAAAAAAAARPMSPTRQKGGAELPAAQITAGKLSASSRRRQRVGRCRRAQRRRRRRQLRNSSEPSDAVADKSSVGGGDDSDATTPSEMPYVRILRRRTGSESPVRPRRSIVLRAAQVDAGVGRSNASDSGKYAVFDRRMQSSGAPEDDRLRTEAASELNPRRLSAAERERKSLMSSAQNVNGYNDYNDDVSVVALVGSAKELQRRECLSLVGLRLRQQPTNKTKSLRPLKCINDEHDIIQSEADLRLGRLGASTAAAENRTQLIYGAGSGSGSMSTPGDGDDDEQGKGFDWLVLRMRLNERGRQLHKAEVDGNNRLSVVVLVVVKESEGRTNNPNGKHVSRRDVFGLSSNDENEPLANSPITNESGRPMRNESSSQLTSLAMDSINGIDGNGNGNGIGFESGQTGASNNKQAETNESAESECEVFDTISQSMPSHLFRNVVSLAYGSVFFFGLLGNTITLLVLLREWSTCSVIDIFIGNLALSDIMLCIFAVPITPIYMLYEGHWTFGLALCKGLSFAQCASVYISTFTLIIIAVVRYRMILHPLAWQLSRSWAFLCCLATWSCGILITMPYLHHVSLLPQNCDIKFCDELWDGEYDRFYFSVATLFNQFFAPLGLIGYLHAGIFRRLNAQVHERRHQRTVCQYHNNNNNQQHQPSSTISPTPTTTTANNNNNHNHRKSPASHRMRANTHNTTTMLAEHPPLINAHRKTSIQTRELAASSALTLESSTTTTKQSPMSPPPTPMAPTATQSTACGQWLRYCYCCGLRRLATASENEPPVNGATNCCLVDIETSFARQPSTSDGLGVETNHSGGHALPVAPAVTATTALSGPIVRATSADETTRPALRRSFSALLSGELSDRAAGRKTGDAETAQQLQQQQQIDCDTRESAGLRTAADTPSLDLRSPEAPRAYYCCCCGWQRHAATATRGEQSSSGVGGGGGDGARRASAVGLESASSSSMSMSQRNRLQHCAAAARFGSEDPLAAAAAHKGCIRQGAGAVYLATGLSMELSASSLSCRTHSRAATVGTPTLMNDPSAIASSASPTTRIGFEAAEPEAEAEAPATTTQPSESSRRRSTLEKLHQLGQGSTAAEATDRSIRSAATILRHSSAASLDQCDANNKTDPFANINGNNRHTSPTIAIVGGGGGGGGVNGPQGSNSANDNDNSNRTSTALGIIGVCTSAASSNQSHLGREGQRQLQQQRPARQQQQAAIEPTARLGAKSEQKPKAKLDVFALKEQREREKERRISATNWKLLLMVLLFTCSWLPLNVFNMVQDYFPKLANWPYIKHIFCVVHLVACSSVCVNPILYAWMSDNYRQKLSQVMPRTITLSSPSPTHALIGYSHQQQQAHNVAFGGGGGSCHQTGSGPLMQQLSASNSTTTTNRCASATDQRRPASSFGCRRPLASPNYLRHSRQDLRASAINLNLNFGPHPMAAAAAETLPAAAIGCGPNPAATERSNPSAKQLQAEQVGNE